MLSPMILRWVITGYLLLTPAARASVTVAWKIPVSSLISGYQTHPKVHKLDKPPLPSPVFESADPLWDISEALSSRWRDPEGLHSLPHSGLPPIAGSWTGEFIVWNEKSGLIVARGEENEIAALETILGFQKLPETFSTKVELIDARTPDQPSRSLSLLARNHEKASAKTAAFKATLTTTDVYLPLREVELTATWQTRDQVSCHVDASATVRDGVPFRFAKKDSEELLVTVTRVLPDGSPYLTGRSREINGVIEPWPEEREAPIPPAQPLGGHLFIGWFPMTPPDTWGIDSRDLKK
ncbi:MAG: hypothetical protein JWO82_1708, partial [Akkermansiaceae bacterium]|nr:hypothetical protein [Akkermansiaceae bacterium]